MAPLSPISAFLSIIAKLPVPIAYSGILILAALITWALVPFGSDTKMWVMAAMACVFVLILISKAKVIKKEPIAISFALGGCLLLAGGTYSYTTLPKGISIGLQALGYLIMISTHLLAWRRNKDRQYLWGAGFVCFIFAGIMLSYLFD